MATQHWRTARLLAVWVTAVLALGACGAADTADTDDAASEAADSDSGGESEAGSDAATEEAEAVQTVALTIAPPAPVPAGFPSYFLAEGYGFFAQECLEVEQVDPGQAATAALETDRLDIAGIGFPDVVPIVAEGQEIDVQAFMATDLMPFLFVTFEDSGITSIADLEGQNIGINEPHDATDAEFLLASAGLQPDDYQLTPVGEDRAALVALENGDIAAFMGAFRGANTALPELASKPLRLIENESAGGYYNGAVMATGTMIEEQPDIPVRFGRAMARAMIWQWENPELSAEVMLEVAPEAAEDVEQMTTFLEVNNEYHQTIYDEQFEVQGDRVQGFIDTWAELGLIDEPFDASPLYTTELMDQILDFDWAAEQEAARTATEAPQPDAACAPA